MAAGTRINDGGQVAREIVGVSIAITQGKSKGNLQRDLRCADEFAVAPRLTINRNFTTGSNCIQERLAITSKSCSERYYAGNQWNAFPVAYGHLVDSGSFSKR